MSIENIYGHDKKRDFIISCITRYAAKKSMSDKHIRVLDVGCGNCKAITFYVASRGYRVVGVDTHKESIEYASVNNKYPNLELVNCSVEDLPGEYVDFDVIICSDVLEHLQQPLLVLYRLQELLKPDGMILCSIPNGYGPFEMENRFARWTGLSTLVPWALSIYFGLKEGRKEVFDSVPYNYESGHVQFFTLREFKRITKVSRLVIEKQQNGCFVGSSISDLVVGRFKRFIDLNVNAADRLPAWMVSTWYFVLIPARTY